MNALLVAGLFGAAAVGLGAFGAHGLGESLSAEARGWWETATLYLLVHAALAAALAATSRSRLAVWLLLAGAGIFAGTLYAMALGAPSVLGAVTPLGGMGMIGGWLALAASALRTKS